VAGAADPPPQADRPVTTSSASEANARDFIVVSPEDDAKTDWPFSSSAWEIDWNSSQLDLTQSGIDPPAARRARVAQRHRESAEGVTPRAHGEYNRCMRP
jgi:hypothetical protein